MKFRAALLLGSLFCAPLNAACAWPVVPGVYGGAGTPPPTPIVLQSTTDTFGALTPKSRGGVRLSSADSTSTGYHFYGLDFFVAGNSCAKWNVTLASGTTGQWTLPGADTPEGAAAITPIPANAGVTAGTYVFNVSCKDSTGLSSNTVTLTRTVIANAVNFGTTDSDSGMVPSGFGGTTGQKILLSTGANRTGIRNVFNSVADRFANEVTFTQADPARPAGILNMEPNGATNWKIDGIFLTGNLNTAPSLGGLFFFSNGAAHITLVNSGAVFNQAMWTGATPTLSTIGFSGASNITVDNFTGDWLANGFQENAYNDSNIVFKNSTLRHIFDNAVLISSGANITFQDDVFLAPMRRNGDHTDYFQIFDGATPTNLTIKRVIMAQADGVASMQGIFGGTASFYTGCSITGTALSCSNPPNKAAFANRAIITGVGVTPGTRIVSKVDNNDFVVDTSQTVAGPITIKSAPFDSFTVNGFVYAGQSTNVITWPGESGTSSISNVTLIKQNNPNYNQTTFTASINGTALTISGPITGIAGVAATQLLSYTGCNRCVSISSGSGNNWVLSANKGVVTSQAMSTSYDYPLPNGPWVFDGNVDTPTLQHIGSMTLTSWYIWDNFNAQNSPPTPTGAATGNYTIPSASFSIPTNTTYSNVTTGGLTLNGAVAAAAVAVTAFKNGNPELSLEAIPSATWAAMTPAQVATTICAAALPKTSGPLDASAGAWYAAFTQAGAWNDGSGTSICP